MRLAGSWGKSKTVINLPHFTKNARLCRAFYFYYFNTIIFTILIYIAMFSISAHAKP
jgi:hypothetical protein